MDKNTFEDKWKQIRGQSKGWWSRITDSDLNAVDKAEVKFFKYLSLLQSRYGYDRLHAKAEISRRVTEYEASLKTNTVTTP
jgi:hypothetical protein